MSFEQYACAEWCTLIVPGRVLIFALLVGSGGFIQGGVCLCHMGPPPTNNPIQHHMIEIVFKAAYKLNSSRVLTNICFRLPV